MAMHKSAHQDAPCVFTEEWLLGAIDVISEVIILHGAKYGPWLERLERELAEIRRKDDPVNRAREHLKQRAPRENSEAFSFPNGPASGASDG